MKKLYIETYGCQMNVADSEVVASVMQMADYETTENIDEADAVFEYLFGTRQCRAEDLSPLRGFECPSSQASSHYRCLGLYGRAGKGRPT